MKKFLLLSALVASVSGVHAFDKSAVWNSNYVVQQVRQNGNNWIAFSVTPKHTSTSGNIVDDRNMWFGVEPSHPRYAQFAALMMTAKSTGRTVSFCVCNAGPIANTGGTVWNIASTGGLSVE